MNDFLSFTPLELGNGECVAALDKIRLKADSCMSMINSTAAAEAAAAAAASVPRTSAIHVKVTG